MIIIRLTIIVGLSLLYSACTTTGPELPKKWDPERRAESHVLLGQDYLRRGKYEIAREEFDLAISINPKSDRAHHGKGLLLAQTGYKEEARKMLAKAVSLNESNFLAVNDYGIYLCQNDDYEMGISSLSRVEARPDNQLMTNTQLGLGICNYGKGDVDSAKRYFRLVLKALPSLPQALLPMAEISYNEQKFLSARAFIERYIAAGAISEKALVLGANTELQLGDSAKAKQYAQELRRVYPTSDQLQAFRSLFSNG
jgi:type IV pilus assembly protein PilF